jgi:hypothetical protein
MIAAINLNKSWSEGKKISIDSIITSLHIKAAANVNADTIEVLTTLPAVILFILSSFYKNSNIYVVKNLLLAMKNIKKKKILVIVSHPDDEIIWMGGEIMQSSLDKTVVCLCRRTDKDRFPKFLKVCKIANFKGFISDLDDSEEGYYKKITNEDIIKRILQFTKGESYDCLYTHGENGESGHIRHLEIHRAVLEMLNKNLLKTKKAFFFSYNRDEDGICYAKSSADKITKLDKQQLEKKQHIVRDIYGYPKSGFEVRCCKDIEAFDIRKVKQS